MEQNQYVLPQSHQYRVAWKQKQHPAAKKVIIESTSFHEDPPMVIPQIPNPQVEQGESVQEKNQPSTSDASQLGSGGLIPKPQAKFKYDAFIVEWVQEHLLPPLEHAGLHICIDSRDFEIGTPSLVNMQNAVRQSRKTLLVLTPNWVESEWTEFESLLVHTKDPIGLRKMITPLLVRKCDLPDHLAIFT
jgi:hypothetical protein